MDWSEIKQIFRRVLHNKTFSVINTISLSIGLTCSLLAFLYVQYEFKVDKCFTNTSDVYRLTINNIPPAEFHIGQPPIFFDEILKEIPEIQSGSRIFYDPVNINIENERFNGYFLGVDSSFFNLLGWEMVVGNPDKVLSTPFSVVISESKAKQLFKDKNPIGEIIEINNLFKYTITGIFKDIPKQSHIISDFFASIPSMQKRNDDFFASWGNHSTAFYFKVKAGSDVNLINSKIAVLWNKENKDSNCSGDFVRSKLQPFSDIHLRSGYLDKNPGNIIYVLGIAIIASLILLISCFNFINLSIAIKSRRNVETGIKKILGANLKTFIRQILTEILIYLSTALIISFVSVKLILPWVNIFIDKNLNTTLHNNFLLISFTIIVSLIIVILASLFPVIQMFKVNTANELKGVSIFSIRKSRKTISRVSFRNILVTTQFTIGIVLILSSILINKQLRLIRQHDLGFDKEQVMVIHNDMGNSYRRFNILKNELANIPEVKTISSASHVPAGGLTNWDEPSVVGDEINLSKKCGLVSINHQYFNVIGSEFAEGRDFKEINTTDKDKIIINEALQKELRLTNPIGTKLSSLRDKKEREIVGVVKDIEFSTIHSKNIPVVFFLRGNGFDTFNRYIVIKLKSPDLTKTIASIKEDWKQISPEFPIEYFFLDDLLNQNYKSESQTSVLMNVMTLIAIFLCSLGLFGLAIYNINGRIKEIGIRKVNGAKISEILTMLNKDFVKWVAIAFVIACPIACYAMHKWLENFAYKTSLSWWIFALAGLLALGIALLTVSWQSWKAATRNPVEALRYE